MRELDRLKYGGFFFFFELESVHIDKFSEYRNK